MRKLVYDVACSIDGFITGNNGSVEQFLFEGDHVDEYKQRLSQYGIVLMGRRTYESGYRWGLNPGDLSYPGMQNVVVSTSIELPTSSAVRVIRANLAQEVRALKAEATGDLYLCGGGELARQLLEQNCIDRLILKLNPIILGRGTRLFADTIPTQLSIVSSVAHQSGVITITYDVTPGDEV